MIKDSAEAVERMEVFLLGSRETDRQKLKGLKKELAKIQNQVDYFVRKEKLQTEIVAFVFVKKRTREELVEQFSHWADRKEVEITVSELVFCGVLESDIDWKLSFAHRFWHYPDDAVYH